MGYDKEYIDTLLKEFTLKDKAHLGETLLSLMLSASKVFEAGYKYSEGKTLGTITLNQRIRHKIGMSELSFSHLPMLVKPNKAIHDNYFPYLIFALVRYDSDCRLLIYKYFMRC